MNILNKIFKVKKPIIGMLHLGYLLGNEKYKGLNYVIKKAIENIKSLEEGGIDGILIENWKEDSIGQFISTENAVSFSIIANELSKHIHVPFGINVLNNDYKVALSVAKLTGASFVELDVFVDHVKSNFKYSPVASKNPFEIKLNPNDVIKYAKSIKAMKIPIFVIVQPKHYKMLEVGKSIEKSTKQAIRSGASAILVTKETGTAPTLDLIRKSKKAAGNYPVGIGSGFNEDNADEFLKCIDFAIVGSSIKQGGDVNKKVDKLKVKKLMAKIKSIRGIIKYDKKTNN